MRNVSDKGHYDKLDLLLTYSTKLPVLEPKGGSDGNKVNVIDIMPQWKWEYGYYTGTRMSACL